MIGVPQGEIARAVASADDRHGRLRQRGLRRWPPMECPVNVARRMRLAYMNPTMSREKSFISKHRPGSSRMVEASASSDPRALADPRR